MPYRQILKEEHFLTIEDRKKAAPPNARKTFPVLAKGHNRIDSFISEAEVCGGVRRSCFLRSEQHEDPSKAGVRVSVQGLVLEQVSA